MPVMYCFPESESDGKKQTLGVGELAEGKDLVFTKQETVHLLSHQVSHQVAEVTNSLSR
jgi:hypothetical protein